MIEINPGGKMSHLKKITLFLALAGCLLGHRLPAYGTEEIKSNLDVLTELAEGVAGELISGFQSSLDDHSGVRLVPIANDSTYKFLMNIFTVELTARGIKTYTSGARASSGTAEGNEGAMELNIQAIEFSLSYPKIFRSYLIGGKRVKRHAEITLFAELIDSADRSVAWVGEATREYDDQFNYSDRTQVEKSLFEFTKPKVTPPNWARVIEPVVVSGIIVGLVYLFFSNQSDS
jgi:hypothetical protein